MSGQWPSLSPLTPSGYDSVVSDGSSDNSFYGRSPTESKRRHEQKQAKAQVLREKLLQEKAERLRMLSKKVGPSLLHNPHV